MSLKKFAISSSNFLYYLYFGLTVGLLIGLICFVSDILSHDYLSFNMHNLIIFDFQSEITKYVIKFGAIALISYIIVLIVNKISELQAFKSYKLNHKYFSTVLFFIKLTLISLAIYFVFYSEVWVFLKVLSRNRHLEFLGYRRVTRVDTLYTLFYIASVGFLVFITYLFARLNIIESINSKLQSLLSSKQIKFSGISVIVILIVVNLGTYLYINNNKPDSPNILLITIDTLRAEHLSSYGNERKTSPNIDKLAERGAIYKNAYSQAPWTYPSMASMHTSLYPSQLGLRRFENKMDNKNLTIAEYLKNNFYVTYGVVSNLIVSEVFGFKQGFDYFENTYSTKPDDITSVSTTEKAMDFIKKNKDNAFFAWVHYMDPHAQYLDHDEYDYTSGYDGKLASNLGTVKLNMIKDKLDENDVNFVRDLYDEEVSFTDLYVGKLIDLLSELDIEDHTIIILTSDHGEEFLDRTRFGHGFTLYQELIKVPLIIYNPLETKSHQTEILRNVEVRHIAKSIVDFVYLEDNPFECCDLFAFDKDDISYNIVISENVDASTTATYLDEWKLIRYEDSNTYELFNLVSDPLEKSNLADSEDFEIITIRQSLELALSKQDELKKVESGNLALESDHVEKIKALGYMQ